MKIETRARLRGQELIDLFDPRLKLVNPCRDEDDKKVYKVSLGSSAYFFRAFLKNNPPPYDCAENEKRALKELSDISGVVKLVDDLGNIQDCKAYLVEAITGNLITYDSPIRERSIQRQLLDIVREMHRRGIAHGDLTQGNVILSYDRKKLTAIDFEYCAFKDNPPERYKDRSNYDWFCVSGLFGKIRTARNAMGLNLDLRLKLFLRDPAYWLFGGNGI
jgi:serine/threonine protein kinase